MTTPHHANTLTPDQLKTQVGQAALDYVVRGAPVGVGTGSTVNQFIAALATIKHEIAGAVSSSLATTQRLRACGIAVLEASAVGELPVYIDGADEINHHGQMIKGGGAALTCEKILAAQSRQFVCIADASKLVHTLGQFPVPLEVVPMAVARVQRQFAAMGAQASLRLQNGVPWVTDNGQHIVDVRGLQIADPLAFEMQVSQWPGVLTVGVFAVQKAHLCLLGTAAGVRKMVF
jgi:ribose 5-phosphate isomerase A